MGLRALFGSFRGDAIYIVSFIKKPNSIIKVLLAFAVLAIGYQSCTSADDEGADEQHVASTLAYVGDKACKSCHLDEYEKWTDSHHYRAMELPSEESVEGDFNNTKFSADGVDYFFFKADEGFKVVITDAGVTDTFNVKYTFGFTPLQQYLVETNSGKIQTLRVSWDTEKGLWFHQYASEKIAKDDWFHFTNQSANWNGMCSSCHSTNVVKAFNPKDESYHTTFDVLNVSCESCHGAGSKHVAMAVKEDYRPDNNGFPEFGIGNKAQVNMCGGCHARRGQYHDAVQPGEDFHDAFNLSWIDERNYEVDGQIKEEDYILGSFLSSKMYHKGVACTDCHDNHSMKLKLDGNALCTQCHEPKYDSKAHHFHEVDTKGANCVDCHMAGKTYMGNDFRRDHSFRIPRPDQSEKYGTPNACNGCHADKKASWAAAKVEEWYGKNRPTHFSDFLLDGWEGGNSWSLVTLANDTAMPVIARGTAIQYLSLLDLNAVIANIKKWTVSNEVLIRKAAQQAIRDFPIEQRLVYASPALKDKSRSVRLEAVTNLIDVDQNDLPPAYKSAYYQALNEYETYLKFSADFPEGQGQIGQ